MTSLRLSSMPSGHANGPTSKACCVPSMINSFRLGHAPGPHPSWTYALGPIPVAKCCLWEKQIHSEMGFFGELWASFFLGEKGGAPFFLSSFFWGVICPSDQWTQHPSVGFSPHLRRTLCFPWGKHWIARKGNQSLTTRQTGGPLPLHSLWKIKRFPKDDYSF